jgi:hypothetical protein
LHSEDIYTGAFWPATKNAVPARLFWFAFLAMFLGLRLGHVFGVVFEHAFSVPEKFEKQAV